MRPLRIATFVASLYLVPSLVYIFVSSSLVASMAGSPPNAAMIEILKGFAFVTFSALVIFGICWKTITVAMKKDEEIRALGEAFLCAERQGLASTLAAAIAHDARNELTIIKSNTQFLQHHTEPDDTTAEIYREQQEAIARLTELTEFLTNAGRPQELGNAQRMKPSRAVRQVLNSLRDHPRLRDVDIEIRLKGEEHKVLLYPSLLHQTLINLLFNAADAMDQDGRVELVLEFLDPGVAIEVHDNGPGFAPGTEDHLFEAFYTTKEFGTGLGLVSVKACALAHGGDATPQPSRLGGACMRVTLREAVEAPYATEELGLYLGGNAHRPVGALMASA